MTKKNQYKDPKKMEASLANLRPYKPGQSGNPNGRPAIPEDVLAARKLTDNELIRVLNKFLNMTKPELYAYMKKEDASMMELTVGSIVLKAYTGSDHQRLDFLLTRMIGKPKESIQEHTLNLRMLPREKVIELGIKAINQLSGNIVDAGDADE